MVTLRCTQKYRKAFRLPEKLPEPAASTTVLGEWYANTLSIGHNRLVHYMSGSSLLSVIVPLRDRKLAEDRLREELRAFLDALGVDADIAERELRLMSEMSYSRASNRSVQASMRDQAKVAKDAVIRRGVTSTWQIMLDLAEMPCGALGYDHPGRETRRLFAIAQMRPDSA
jgi:Domain of unknown function (DUF6933)